MLKNKSWERILVCCDSFKGTLSACDAGRVIEGAFRRAEGKTTTPVEVMHCPMSDGGDGLLDSMLFPSHSGQSSPYHFKRVDVPIVSGESGEGKSSVPVFLGPLGEPLNTPKSKSAHRPYFAADVEKRVVVIEMALASGLPMLTDAERNPLRTTSYGVGQLIKYAIEYVANENRRKYGASADGGVTVFLGIGGSATNDGGIGALQALGMELFVKPANGSTKCGKCCANAGMGNGQLLTTPFTGGDLPRLTGARLSPACRQMFFRSPSEGPTAAAYCKEVRLICDVASPLIGPDGATSVFGPQKCNPAWDKAHRASVLAQLEGGMKNAAACFVRSGLHDCLTRANGVESACVSPQEREKTLAALCHTAGGGGAGGMSGFFRYVLRATWMAGTDVVAELLGLPEKLRHCDCMITGEGSFDTQTIRFNKTLGRLLQLAVMENMRRRREAAAAGGNGTKVKMLRDVVVVCGRMSYSGGEEVRRLLLTHMQTTGGPAEREVCAEAIPRVHLLSLTPRHFPVKEALGNAGVCVGKLMLQFLVDPDFEKKEKSGAASAVERKMRAKM
ncbi:putative glycerate kinase [Trypanosoma theileri]|uniref:Putative glycerate kinase n=2 Tax=Trypanosoma theileri TaxID=67003 RepID=A0A1X0NLE3_9TRYP|nr:putative glycerate kinase [Trypanosoma theileri]ORC84979.1 putative glycerate kinase [Trypanosoma theileri]